MAPVDPVCIGNAGMRRETARGGDVEGNDLRQRGGRVAIGLDRHAVGVAEHQRLAPARAALQGDTGAGRDGRQCGEGCERRGRRARIGVVPGDAVDMDRRLSPVGGEAMELARDLCRLPCRQRASEGQIGGQRRVREQRRGTVQRLVRIDPDLAQMIGTNHCIEAGRRVPAEAGFRCLGAQIRGTASRFLQDRTCGPGLTDMGAG